MAALEAHRRQVLGDMRGQLGSCRLAERRVNELLAKYGRDKVEACCARLFELGEAAVRAAVAEWADGRYEAERFIDDDGVDLNKPVRVHRGRREAPATGCSDQTRGRPTSGHRWCGPRSPIA